MPSRASKICCLILINMQLPLRHDRVQSPGGGGGGVLPYMGYIGMCRSEGYGFQAVYSRIGYMNQSVWV